MARTPKRIHGPAQVSNSAATKYTVPALTKTVIRHIHVENPSLTSSDLFTMSIGSDSASVRLFDQYLITSGAQLDHFGYYVVDAAEIIQAFANINNNLVLTIDGDEITLG